MEENDFLNISNDISVNRTHNRSKTFQKLSKLCKTQPQESKDTFDPYTSFIYRDHVTRNRYEISKLKSRKLHKNYRKVLKDQQIQKIRKTEENDEFQYFSEELNFLKSIRQNRNKELMAGFMKLREEKSQTHNTEAEEIRGPKIYCPEGTKTILNRKKHISNIKKKIQTEVMSLNQQFLREYLYYEQPFNQKLIEINRSSYSKIIDQEKINKLKKNLIQCISERKTKQNDPHFKNNKTPLQKQDNQQKIYTEESQKKWRNWVTTYYERKAVKQSFRKQIDKKFEKIWQDMGQQIAQKVKFEGQFNWRSKNYKKIKIK